jgi:hypothetical protein
MMITKHNIIVLAASATISAAIFFFYEKNPAQKINYNLFHKASGWGYDILVNDKLFIHQEYIPVVANKKGFATETEAKKTARLVINKLKNNKMPTLNYAEVNQICRY